MKNNWQKVPLSELTEDDSPITYGVVKPGGYGDVVFVRGGDISQGFILLDQLRTITKEVSEQYRRTLLRGGELLICLVGQPGQVAVAPPELAGANIARQVGLIRLHKNVNAEYVRYFLQSKNGQDALGAYTGGSVQQVINLGDLRTVEIPIPSLPEQQRIVSVLDEAFASIAQAKSNAERNLVNARELFDSYVGNIFAKPSEEWEEKKLGDKSIIEIIDNDRGVNYPKKSDFHPEGYCLFMNTKNVRPDGFDFTTTMFITEKKDKSLGKGKLSRNDVVMTTRGTIGNLGVYNAEVPFEQVRTNSGMLIFRPNLKYIVPEYLFEILRSGIIKSQIKKHVSGAAQPQLPIKTLVNFTFPLPKSLAEQRAIVGRLEALSAETGRLEEIYQSKLDALEELRKSVLQKAFVGEL